MERKEFEIDVKGKPCKVVMEPLTWGLRNEALRKATTIDLATEKATIDGVGFGEWRLVYSIKDMELVGWKTAGSEDAKMKLLRGLPMSAGDALSRAEQDLNKGVSVEEGKKNSDSDKNKKSTA